MKDELCGWMLGIITVELVVVIVMLDKMYNVVNQAIGVV
tara:strand:+ start:1381 stop:1497 length:117 start_codon:yes stop_codon:yes gene_type:complete